MSMTVYRIAKPPNTTAISLCPFSIAIAAGAANNKDGISAIEIRKPETIINITPFTIIPHSPSIANHIKEIIPAPKLNRINVVVRMPIRPRANDDSFD